MSVLSGEQVVGLPFPGIVALGMVSRSWLPGAGWPGAQAYLTWSVVNKQEVAGEGPGAQASPFRRCP